MYVITQNTCSFFHTDRGYIFATSWEYVSVYNKICQCAKKALYNYTYVIVTNDSKSWLLPKTLPSQKLAMEFVIWKIDSDAKGADV